MGDFFPFLRSPALFSLVEYSLFLFHEFVEFVEVDVGEYRGDYTSYKVANMVLEFSTSIPRRQLRPSYGDGFLDAPLHTGPPRESPMPQEQGGQRGTSSTPKTSDPGGPQHL